MWGQDRLRNNNSAAPSPSRSPPLNLRMCPEVGGCAPRLEGQRSHPCFSDEETEALGVEGLPQGQSKEAARLGVPVFHSQGH